MKILKNCKGSSLVLVMIVFLFLITISAALLTATYASFNSATQQQISQQAYFTARSAANATIDYIQKYASDVNAMNNIINNIGTGSVPSMGSYNVTVQYLDINNIVTANITNKMKIFATAIYNKQTSKVVAYLSKPADVASGYTDMLFYITSGDPDNPSPSSIGQCTLKGDIFFGGDFSVNNGTKVDGIVVCSGNATISGGANTTKGIISFGNITLANGAIVAGDVMALGNLNLSGSGTITGNAFCDGSLYMASGSSKINGNATIGQNASFGGGSNRIDHDLTTGGTYSVGYGTINTFVSGTATQNAPVAPLDLSGYTGSTPPAIPVPTIAQNPQLYTPVTLSGNTISSSGMLAKDGTLYLNTSGLSWGKVITIDASSTDISLLIKNTAYNMNNGVDFKIIGSHYVTIYMTGNSSLNINTGSFIGMNSDSATLALYIIGDGKQAVTLTNDSELDAYVYIPNGSFSASGDELAGKPYKFKGSMIIASVTTKNNINVYYIQPPNLANSPLAALASSGSGSGGSWSIESWSNT